MIDLGFVHRFLPGRDTTSPVLPLLHGTRGDENDLIPLGQELLPSAAILSLRGNVLENDMPRIFRRLAEGVFDFEDLKRRTDELSRFIEKARHHYGLDQIECIAVGYSNGANIAASLILRDSRHLSGAVLFRPMVPFTPEVETCQRIKSPLSYRRLESQITASPVLLDCRSPRSMTGDALSHDESCDRTLSCDYCLKCHE